MHYQFSNIAAFLKLLIIITYTISFSLPCSSATTLGTTPKTNSPKSSPAKPAAKTVAKPAAKPAIKPSPKPVKKRQTISEFELGGFTSELNDQFLGRIGFTRQQNDRKLIIKSSCNLNKSYSYSKTKVYTTQTDTYTGDLQYRVDNPHHYRFLVGNVNTKKVTPQNSTTTTTGFSLIGGGVGRTITNGLDCEAGIAAVNTYNKVTKRQIQPFYTLKMKRGVSSSTVLEGNILFVRPFESDILIDSRANLTFKLNPNIGLRLTYLANNLRSTATTRSGWDRSIRISLLFRNIDNK